MQPGFVAIADAVDLASREAAAWRTTISMPTERNAQIEQLAKLLDAAFQGQQYRAAGVNARNGDLFWIPASAWRVPAKNRLREQVCMVLAALTTQNKPIRCALPKGNRISCYPILISRDLADILRAENPPDPPLSADIDTIRELTGHPGLAQRTSTPAARIADQSPDVADQQTSILTAQEELPPRKRGPKDKKGEKIMLQMLGDLCSGKRTCESLWNEKEESLATTYNASRATVRLARKRALDTYRADPARSGS